MCLDLNYKLEREGFYNEEALNHSRILEHCGYSGFSFLEIW